LKAKETKMKKFWLISFSLIILLAISGLTGCVAGTTGGTETSVITNQQQGIWVTGEGKVSVTPDIVNISLGVQSQETSVSDAMKKTSDAMARVMDILKANNIADKDIQTQQFSIYPQYSLDQTTGKQTITGYQVTNTLNVKLRDINKVGTLIDAVVAAGGNLTVINNVNFTVEDPTRYYDEARQKAIDDANEKAQEIASLYGVTLGKPTYVLETSSTPYPIYYGGSGGPAIMTEQQGTSISAGSTDIVLDIQVSFTMIKK
jgi:uncharacterized protein